MRKLLLSLCLTFLFLAQHSYAQSNRTAWFEESRYGMFIHWGLYSAAEGLWKGEPLRYLNNYAEWIQYRNRIAQGEYSSLAKRFDWEAINAEEWVLLAKKSGMKYIIMTAKHHDGLAIWDSKIGNYTLPKLAASKRDIIQELADACRKHDMKLGFYYSHWIDWDHPYAWDHNQELTGHVTDAQFNQYWQEKAIPQLRELLTNYGDIALMWFDMWIPYEKSIFKKEQLEQAVQLIHELQPNCLINSRLGLPTDAKYVDFETLGDNEFGSAYTDHPWETPGTIAHSWGYNGQEKNWKSTGQLFESLISNVALNGGFTLNIGPRADGSVPYESIDRLDNVGEWLARYGESIYGNTGVPLRANQHDWGKITYNTARKQVYLQVFNWPLDRTIRLTGINRKPHKVELLQADGSTTPLTYTQAGPLMHIHTPAKASDHYVSVIRISYDSLEWDKEVVAESTFGGFALHSNNLSPAIPANQIAIYDGTRPTHFRSEGDSYQWKVYFPAAGTYAIDLSAHNPGEENTTLEVNCANSTLTYSWKPNGKLVAEPNENNYTDEFVNAPIGDVSIPKAGYYTLSLKTTNNQILYVNRLWINTQEK